jgi:hypothetical protein
LSVYPNPIKEDRYVSLILPAELQSGSLEISVFTIQGRKTFSKSYLNVGGGSLEIYLENNLPSGMYVLEVKGKSIEPIRRKILLK